MDARALRDIPFFRHVSSRRLKWLRTVAHLERYPKGAVLFRQGTAAEAIWIVVEGWVHLLRSPDGDGHASPSVLFTITPQEALCGISAIESGVYHLSAIAATDCQAIRIPRQAFHELVRHEPEVSYAALRLCARRLQHIAQQYGAVAEPVSQRLIRTILRLQDQFGSTIPMTHRELAQMAWTTTESAIRIIRKLKHDGVVGGRRGQLVIQQPKVLQQLLAQRTNSHRHL